MNEGGAPENEVINDGRRVEKRSMQFMINIIYRKKRKRR